MLISFYHNILEQRDTL